MALRLYSEFKSSNEAHYRIEIYDDSWAVAASSFSVGGDGFRLKYDGNVDTITTPIIGSHVEIDLYNNNAAVDAFIADLKDYQEARFSVKILKSVNPGEYYAEQYQSRVESGGGTVEAIQCVTDTINEMGADDVFLNFWTGRVVQDLISIEDASSPNIVTLSATDGIAQLSNTDAEFIANVTIKDFVEDAVNAMSLDTLYTATDEYYKTCVNVWDSQHTYSTTQDVSDIIRFSTLVFSEKDEDATIVYDTFYNILKEICISYGARFYQQEGAYIFEQYKERSNAERRVYTYDKNGTELSNELVDDDFALNQTTTGGARMSGNVFNFLPALKKVSISYNQERLSNLLANRLTFTAVTPAQDLGFVTSLNNGQLRVNTLLSYRFDYDGSGTTAPVNNYRPIWKFRIRVEDVSSPGTFYYLKRDFSPSNGQLYTATSWTTTPSDYSIDIGSAKNNAQGLYIQGATSFITPPIPVSGDADIDAAFYGLYDGITHASTSVPTNYTDVNTISEVTVTYLDSAGTSPQVEVFSSVNGDTNVKSNLTLDLGEVRVSDSGGLQGSFYVYDGSSWVRSTGWRRGNTGAYVSLLKLTTKEVLALHAKPIKRYQGRIIGNYHFGNRLFFDESYWVMTSGEFSANMDEWSGEWFEIAYDDTSITAEDPIGIGGDDSVLSVSSQQGTDEVAAFAAVFADEMKSEAVQLTGGTSDQGTMLWNTDEDTIQMQMNGTTHYMGQDVVYNVKNQSGATIDKGTAVMAVGTLGSSGRILIGKARATGETPSRFFLGVTAEDIANGGDGKVIEFGKIRGLNTESYSEGDVLWLDPAVDGGFTTTEPEAPNLKIATAIVVSSHAQTGTILVRATQGHTIADAHDVHISSLADGDVLKWNAANDRWENGPLT